MAQVVEQPAQSPELAPAPAMKKPDARQPWTGNPITKLPLPPTVKRSHILWIYVISFALLHALALLAFVPYFFSWIGLATAIVCVHVFGTGITLCYHRLLTHRSFKAPKWWERCLVMLSISSLEDTPAKWVAWHRIHHLYSDTPEDPHSPHVHWFWGHMGWLMLHNVGTHDIAAFHKYARDILEDRFYFALEKYRWLQVAIYLAHAAIITGIGYALGYTFWGGPAAGQQLALSFLVWVVFVRTVAVWHITWSVNSLTHLFGYRNYDTDEYSRNNWLVALLTVGEGWHNNHHYDQASACNQHHWWEIDIVYYEIKLMELFGLASNVIPPKYVREAERKKRK